MYYHKTLACWLHLVLVMSNQLASHIRMPGWKGMLDKLFGENVLGFSFCALVDGPELSVNTVINA